MKTQGFELDTYTVFSGDLQQRFGLDDLGLGFEQGDLGVDAAEGVSSSGIGGRWALYWGNISSRKVLPLASNTTASGLSG